MLTDSAVSSTEHLQALLYLLTWLLPLGVTLVAVSTNDPAHAHQMVVALPLAFLIALGGYALCGFAFEYGGIGLISNDPNLSQFVAEWSPFDLSLGPGWGLIGLRGFALRQSLFNEKSLLLFVSELALVTTAVCIPLLAFASRVPRLPSLCVAALVSIVCYPLGGNWVRGGGWLSQLGTTVHLGHGFVDYGFSSLFLVGGFAALAGLLAFGEHGKASDRAPKLPRVYSLSGVVGGAFLAMLGWFAMLLSQPLTVMPSHWAALMFGAFLAIGGALLGAMLYGLLVQGAADTGLMGRALLAAMVAIGPGLPFLPMWAIVLVGVATGFLLAPSAYFIDYVLRLHDRAASVAVYGLPAVWGIVAVGLWADGQHGATWNLRPLAASEGAIQGVAGYFPSGDASDLGQLYAQMIGAGAMMALSILVPWLLLMLAAQTYGLPSTIHLKAREYALRRRQAQEARELLRRQGGGLDLWQRARIAYLRLVAGSQRLLLQRSLFRRNTSSRANRSSQRLVVRRRSAGSA